METSIILLGGLGGIIPDLIRLLKLGETAEYKAPDYLKKGFFYFILVLQIGFGALIVYLFKVNDELQAVVYGYAAPQIFTSVASGIINRANGSGAQPVAQGGGRDLGALEHKVTKDQSGKKMATYFY